MKTRFEHMVCFADCDMSWQIRLCDLENYLLLASDDGVSRAGLSPEFLREQYNAGWVLLRLSLQMQSLPYYKDTLTIETWEAKVKHCMVVREYLLYVTRNGEEVQIGQGSSVWSVVNMETREICTQAFRDRADQKADAPALSLPSIRHPERFASPTAVLQHRVHYTDLDMNRHCNSCKYLQFMLNACNGLATVTPIGLDIRYSREIHADELVTVQANETDGRIEYILLDEEGKTACSAVLTANP